MKMPLEIMNFCQASWHRPVIPVLGMLIQENTKFRLPLGYIVGPYHKKIIITFRCERLGAGDVVMLSIR